MKVSKLKTLLYFLGAFLLLATVSVDAASISIIKSSEKTDKNIAKYEVYLDATDGEVSNLTLKIQSNNDKITPIVEAADNVDKALCTNGACALQGTYSTKLKVVNITVENTSDTTIDNLSISASIEGIGNVSSDPITLESIKQEETTNKVQSSNAEISNFAFSVSSATLSPEFTLEGRSYTVTGIKDTVNSITISTTCENCTTTFKCLDNCSIAENKNNRIMLEHGANEIELTTTSEDGKNTNTYNFIIYRGEVEEPSAYLKDLTIEGVELDTKFDMLLNDYTTTVGLDVEKLNIKYELEDPEAKVEIKGADKLVEGENTITITVTSSDGKSKQVYTILVNKEKICDPETEECEEEQKETVPVEKKKNKIGLIILISVIAIAIIGVSGFFIFKKKKNDKKDKTNKKDKNNKIKKAFIETDENNESEETNIAEESEEKPKIKPTVDEALEDLMKTKEIELNDL